MLLCEDPIGWSVWWFLRQLRAAPTSLLNSQHASVADVTAGVGQSCFGHFRTVEQIKALVRRIQPEAPSVGLVAPARVWMLLRSSVDQQQWSKVSELQAAPSSSSLSRPTQLQRHAN